MVDPSRKVNEGAVVPHPDDEAEVRAGLEDAERGETLSEEESAAYVQKLLGDERPAP